MLRIALALSLAGLGLTACGSAKPAGSTDPNAGPSGSSPAVAFSRCMRANGVPNFPDPSGGGIHINASPGPGGTNTLTVNGVVVSGPAFKRAQAACNKYAPAGGTPSAQQIAKVRQQALAMAKCMRAHGVPDFPDPVVSVGPGGHGIAMQAGGPGIDPNAPAFQAAARACGGPGAAGKGG